MDTRGIGEPDALFLFDHFDCDDIESAAAACAADCERRGHEWSTADPGLCMHCGGWWSTGEASQAAA